MLLWMLACALDLEDLDRDGFASDEDCDDTQPSIHPGADEVVADGLDQDCDGVDASLVVAGETHRCWLGSNGGIVCEGANDRGQLEAPPGAWTSLAAGGFHTCALSDDEVRCWGDNRYGQADPPELDGVTWIAASRWASFAEVDGGLACWGLCLLER